MSRTAIISVHPFRRSARKRERVIQEWLAAGRPWPGLPLDYPQIPEWAAGAKVESAGPFQHAVVLTEHKGH